MTRRESARRIKLLATVFSICLILISYRLYQVQIVNGDELRHQAGSQYVRTSVVEYDRGSIYVTDRNNQSFPVANVASGYVLIVNPSILNNNITDSDIELIYQALDKGTKQKLDFARFSERFKDKISDSEDTYEEVLQHLPESAAIEIQDLGIAGLQVYAQRWRNYPADDLLAHVIGFTSYNSDDEIVGTYGLEREFESSLSRGETSIFTNFFAEAFMTAKDAVADSLASDLYLTIDRSAQAELEKIIQQTSNYWSTKSSAGIVMEASTGAIVAMASTPKFDLNNFGNVSDSSVYVNPLVENVYEMGSIIKPLTMAYALDKGVVTKNTHYEDTGKLTVDKSTISNFDGRARGNVAVQEILSQSLNVGTAFLLTKMGSDSFKDYFIKSQLDQLTNIELPNEAIPLTNSLLSSPRQIEYVTASFGQGFAVSPIAVTRALGILANQGKLTQPYIVERVQHELGTWSDSRRQNQVQVISAEAANTTTDMLVKVVDEALRNGDESLRNYSIAAKTGTAQIANSTGSYREDAYLHTFFGYFPAYQPKYVVFLMNEEPVGARYASETLTDPFMSLTKFMINYQNIEPDR